MSIFHALLQNDKKKRNYIKIFEQLHRKGIDVGPGGLHAPPEVAFAMRSWPLLLPTFALSFSFDPLRAFLLLFTASVRSRSPGPPLVPDR